MIVLSLFDGIAAAYIALERSDITVDKYFASEVNKYAIAIAKKNYPDIIQLGNVKNISYFNGILLTKDKVYKTKIDLVIGGSPCQGFSFNRTDGRPNFNDPRSKLILEYFRLIQEINPNYFILENVKMDQRSQDVISDRLGVKPILIDSALVSGQIRERLYWTNIQVKQPEDRNIQALDILTEGGTWYEVKVDSSKLTKPYPAIYSYSTKTGIGKRYTKAKTLLASDEKAGSTLCGNQRKNAVIKQEDKYYYRALLPIEYERLQTIPDNYTAGIADSRRYELLGNSFTVEVISHILKGIKDV